MPRDWPHSPIHRLGDAGVFMVTAGNYLKKPLFGDSTQLTQLCDLLLRLADQYNWRLQAWAVFPNHYHFIALSPAKSETLRKFIRHLHSVSAREINGHDKTPARRVWFEYWESRLTYHKSFLARLNYVHRNAVHHRLVREPSAYAWCSAAWFERKAEPSFYRTVMEFPCDRIKVPDDYSVEPFRF